jgi:hypothetical protein
MVGSISDIYTQAQFQEDASITKAIGNLDGSTRESIRELLGLDSTKDPDKCYSISEAI